MNIKAFLFILWIILLNTKVFSQIPNNLIYQTTLQDASGKIMANISVNAVLSILQGSSNGTMVYSESQHVTSDQMGQINLQIGTGSLTTGNFKSINWENGPYFISINVNSKILVCSQILSVPATNSDVKIDIAKLKKDIHRLENLLITAGIFKLQDIDGNQYKTTTIGSQIWMAENLKTTHYANGDPIPLVTLNTAWANSNAAAYCNYVNNETNAVIYGRLYNFFTVADKRNLCPADWHVPNEEEWAILENYLGGRSLAGGKLKESGTSHWTSPNNGIVKGFGFYGLPGGYRYFKDGAFFSSANYGYWWTSSEDDASNARSRFLYYFDATLGGDFFDKGDGFSVRCIRD